MPIYVNFLQHSKAAWEYLLLTALQVLIVMSSFSYQIWGSHGLLFRMAHFLSLQVMVCGLVTLTWPSDLTAGLQVTCDTGKPHVKFLLFVPELVAATGQTDGQTHRCNA